MRKLKVVLMAIVTVLLIESCGSSNKDKSIDDLLIHFEKSEIIGKTHKMAYESIGAVDGVACNGEGFSIELYKFKKTKDVPNFIPYKNGNFAMLFSGGSEEMKNNLVDIFSSF